MLVLKRMKDSSNGTVNDSLLLLTSKLLKKTAMRRKRFLNILCSIAKGAVALIEIQSLENTKHDWLIN